MGRKNSSSRISPGVCLGRISASVVVDDLDMGQTSFAPNETNPPLVIDPDRMLFPPARLSTPPACSREEFEGRSHECQLLVGVNTEAIVADIWIFSEHLASTAFERSPRPRVPSP